MRFSLSPRSPPSTLAPTFKKNGIDTKIYVFDHNFNYDNASDQNDYPIQLYNKIGNDFEGAELVVGSAYHDYGGDPSEVQDIHNQAPEKEVIFTEASIGEWNEGRKLENRLTEDMNRLVIGLTNNYCRAILFWNLMLDTDKGPNMSGGCTTCYGAVDIDNSNYSTITYNRHYYEICHASSVIRPGAKRIRTSGNAPSNITNQAYQNPDGSFGILLVNTQNAATDVTLRDGTGNVKVTVPASGVVSVLINSESSGIDDVKADDTISQENSYYNLKGQLINGPLEHEVYIKNGQKLIK